MNTFFSFLVLASLIGLVVGLIKPSAFEGIFKEHATRKKVSAIFVGLMILFTFFVDTPDTSTSELNEPVKIINEKKNDQVSDSETTNEVIEETSEKNSDTDIPTEDILDVTPKSDDVPIENPQPTKEASSSNEEAILQKYCEDEWPEDFSVRAYCVSTQREAVISLKQGKPGDIGQTEYNIIHVNCEAEWPKDFSVRAYCEETQFEAVRDLSKGKPSDISQAQFETLK